MNIKVKAINPEKLDYYWNDCKKYIEEGLGYADSKYSLADIYRSLTDKDMILWLVYNHNKLIAAIITEIICYPQEKRLGYFAVAGEDFDQWFHVGQEIEAWAKTEGCKAVEFYGRPGWLKKLQGKGYELTHICMRAPIL